MRVFFTIGGIAALATLAACGGGSGGNDGFTGYPAQTTDDGTFVEQIGSTGISGFVGKTADGTISEVFVRLDESGEDPIYYVALDGGDEVPFSVAFGNEFTVSLRDADNNYLNLVFRPSDAAAGLGGGDPDKENFVDGFIGLQAASLPEEPVSYEGIFSIYSSLGGDYLQMDSDDIFLTVNFTTGAVTGDATGAVGFFPAGDAPGIFEFISLDISGSMDGAVLTATATVTGSATADLDMKGAVYGESAAALLGTMAGSATYDGAEFNLAGYFATSAVPGP